MLSDGCGQSFLVVDCTFVDLVLPIDNLDRIPKMKINLLPISLYTLSKHPLLNRRIPLIIITIISPQSPDKLLVSFLTVLLEPKREEEIVGELEGFRFYGFLRVGV